MPPNNEARVWRLVSLTTWVALVGISAVAITAAWVNHDAAWYLHIAGAWLNGAVLYRDVIDTNPPLIVFITALPVLLGRLLGVSDVVTFKALVFGAAAVTAMGATAGLNRVYTSPASRLLGSSALVFLLLPFVGADFGQREHLATLMVIPYVISSAASASGQPASRRGDMVLGVLAGLGFAMKPHFLVAWMALEVATVATRIGPRTWLRPGVLAVSATILVYGLTVTALFRQYFGMASEVVRVYGGLNESIAWVLTLPEVGVWAGMALLVAFVRLPSGQRRACLVVFATATGFLLAALIQLKGWGYHLYPFRVCGGLFLAMVAATLVDVDAHQPRTGTMVRLAVVAAAILSLVAVTVRSVRSTVSPSGIELARALHTLVDRERADSLAVLSMRTIVFPAFPVVNYTGVTWVLRHHSMWFLPGLYADALAHGNPVVPFRSLGSMGELERQYFEHVVGDLCSHPPDMLIVEPPPESVRRGFGSIDLLAYYRQDGRFARLLAAYEQRERFGPFVAFIRARPAKCAEPQVDPS